MQRIILSLLLLIPSLSSAGIQENLQHFYSRMGGSINETPGGAYSGQQAGHYTLGSLTTRSEVNTLNLISAQGPSYRGGCAGIDIFGGSFSFIKSHLLKRMMQNITTSGMNYAFMIGFEQVCPMCKKTMDQLNRLLQEMNQWGINACETSAAMMGSVLPRTQAVQTYTCSAFGSHSGLLADYAAARQGCGSDGRSTEVLEKVRHDNSEKAKAWQDILTDKGNLAWLILTRQEMFLNEGSGRSQILKELMITLSGSLILKPHSVEAQQWSLLPSKAHEKNLINALMYGGVQNKAKIYQCDSLDEYGCLNPTYTQEITIPEPQAFVGKVKRLLYSIKRKVRSKEELPLTPEELNLVNHTKIPLLKAINVQSAYSFASDIINIEDYAELIARDLLEDYLTELLDLVKIGTNKVIADQETLKQFHVGIREARDRILYLKLRDTQNFNQAMDLVQKLQVLEKMLAGEFSSDMARTLDWAVGRR
jgi:conjugative transfer pilus assembly protein TraH